MRKQKSFLQILVVTVVILNMVLAPVLSNINPVQAEDNNENDFIEKERVELRSTHSNTYQISKNTFRVESSVGKINYRSSNGSYKPVDNNIIKQNVGNYSYVNKANDFTFRAGDNVETGVQYRGPAGVCSFSLLEVSNQEISNTSAKINRNIITYPNIYDGADLEFTVTSEGVKTEIVVDHPTSVEDEYIFDVSNCDPKIFETPTIETTAAMAEIDSNLKVGNENKKLVIKPDLSKVKYIEGEIRIDPTIVRSPTKDTFVMNNGGFSYWGNRWNLMTANYYDPTIGAQFYNVRSLIHFGELSAIPSDAHIERADLRLYHYGSNSGFHNFYVAKVDQNWWENIQTRNIAHSGNYGTSNFPYYNSNSTAIARTVNLNTSIVNHLRGANNGIMLRTSNESAPGLTFCSKEANPYGSGHPCQGAGQAPRLIVEYTVNQSPDTPNPISPNNSVNFIGGCDQSISPATGNCGNISVITEAEVNDPDTRAELDLSHSNFYYRNASTGTIYNSSNISGGDGWGTISDTRDHGNGEIFWKVKSTDKKSRVGNYSQEFKFVVDSTPPEIPLVNALPEYTQGTGYTGTVQIEVTSNKVHDNVSTKEAVEYILQYTMDPTFNSGVYEYPPQRFADPANDPRFELGPYGADGIQGNSDDIINDGTYYIRIKATDKPRFDTNSGTQKFNTSNWSNIVNTTLDATVPIIDNSSITESRISPDNPTSIGIKDDTEISFDYTESYPNRALIEVYSEEAATPGVDTPLKTLEKDISGQSGSGTVSFTWDGTNDSGIFIEDGSYILFPVVVDKAGNRNESILSEIVIVDNNEANITINSPKNDFWINTDTVNIEGQVKAPHDPGPDGIIGTADDERDQDLIRFQYKNILNSLWYDVLTVDDFFEFEETLDLGSNTFEFETEDTVGNVGNLELNINKEQTPPEISNILPNSLINNRQESITFRVLDPDPTGDSSQRSDLPTRSIGEVIPGVDVFLDFQVLDTSQPEPFPTIDKTKKLIEDGVNMDPTLINDIVCSPATGSITSTKNELPSANILDCVISFKTDLQPDGNYEINVRVEDNATNETNLTTTFELDSHIYGELNAPVNTGVYSTSDVLFSGKASKNSQLELNHQTLGEIRTFTLDENLNGNGQDGVLLNSNFTVTCGEFLNVDGRLDTPDEEICTWEVLVLQDFVNSDTDTSNTVVVTYSDDAGNTSVHNRNIIVNLFSFDLTISPDLVYFSPNGDGNQDSIKFSHSATNPTDELNPPRIESYTLTIQNELGEVVRDYSGPSDPNDTSLPLFTLFDGKSFSGDWIEDGIYDYVLSVTTTDGAILGTPIGQIFAKTSLTNEVFITSPVDGYVTTDGVITITGQAPPEQDPDGIPDGLQGETYVDICIDTINPSDPTNCDSWYTVIADEFGFFSTVVVLPRIDGQTQTENIISAIARDDYGNQTAPSNSVSVILDTVDPFNSISITPKLTGITSDEDYQRFLNGEISIDQIRTVVMKANVTENTEQVQLSYANYVNAPNKSGVGYNFISLINNQTETDPILNPFSNPEVKYNHNKLLGDPTIPLDTCSDAAGCTWQYILPINGDYAGIYEVEFKGLKGDTIQSLTEGFSVDGSIPATPIIMIVEKWDTDLNAWKKINNINETHYTKGGQLRFRGAAEPNSLLELESLGITLASTNVSNSGVFEIEVDLDPLITVNNASDGTENGLSCRAWEDIGGGQKKCIDGDFNFNVVAYEEDASGNPINPVPSDESLKVTIDAKAPEAININRVTEEDTIQGWAKTGDQVDFFLESSEELMFAEIIKEDGFVRVMNKNAATLWSETINMDRLEEGIYYTQIRLVDFAENVTIYDSQVDCIDQSCDFRIFIDNTLPDQTNIDKENWSTTWEEGGVNADKTYPEVGRTNPEYVISNNGVEIRGRAEQNQRVDLWVNNQRHILIDVSSNNCSGDGANTEAPDGLVVKYANICDWEYFYEFPSEGTNSIHGVPDHGYTFQVRTMDMAANVSDFTKQEIVYHDTQKPFTPEILNMRSKSYDPVVGWSKNSITKDMKVTLKSNAERFTDLEYSMKTPSGKIEKFDLFVNDTTKVLEKNFELGEQKSDDRDGCVRLDGKRRVGTCSDGNYAFDLASTDAAGNPSDNMPDVKVERDTVQPAKAELNVVPNDPAMRIYLDIDGESYTQILVNGISYGNLGSSSKRFLVVSETYYTYDTKYVWKVELIDRAGNKSEPKYISYTTPPPPVRGAYTCENPEGSGKLDYPFEGNYSVTSFFGWRDLDGDGENESNHTGVDFGTPMKTEILASHKGSIIYSNRFDRDAGLGVIMHHQELGVNTLYWHFDKTYLRTNHGKVWEEGTVLGLSGNTGFSTGPHLHFAVRTGGPGTELNPFDGWLAYCYDRNSEGGCGAGESESTSADLTGNESSKCETNIDPRTGMEKLDFSSIEEEEIDILDALLWEMFQQSVFDSAKRDMEQIQSEWYKPWNLVKLYGHYLWGMLKGLVSSLTDVIELVWNLVTNASDTLSQLFDAIKQIWENPKILIYAVYDYITSFLEKDIYGKMEHIGEIVGSLLPDILLTFVGGAGIAKFVGTVASKVKTALSSLQVAAKISSFANKVKTLVVGAVNFTIKFTANALVKIKDFAVELAKLAWNKLDDMFSKISTKLNIQRYFIWKKLKSVTSHEYIPSLANGWKKYGVTRGNWLDDEYAKFLNLKHLGKNFPVVDVLDAQNRVVRSFKSIDLGGSTYQNISKLKSQLKKYIDDLNNFTDRRWGGSNVTTSQYDTKQLDLILETIPSDPNQAKAIQETVEYANSLNINLNLVISSNP